MSNEWAPDTVFDILADERVRQIICATQHESKSAKELVNHCDGSESSIYRRIDILTNKDLLEETTKIDPDGHHYSVYSPGFNNMIISLDEDHLVMKIEDTRKFPMPGG